MRRPPGSHLAQLGLVPGKQFDLDGLGRVGEVVDVVLQDLGQLYVEPRLGGVDFVAHFVHHIPNRSAAIGLELNSEVAGVGFGDGSQAHLEARAARCVLDFGSRSQDALHMIEHAVGFSERAARGHDVVKDEAALIHFREEIGGETLVRAPRADNQQQAGCAQPQRLGQRPLQHPPVNAQNTRHHAACRVFAMCIAARRAMVAAIAEQQQA